MPSFRILYSDPKFGPQIRKKKNDLHTTIHSSHDLHNILIILRFDYYNKYFIFRTVIFQLNQKGCSSLFKCIHQSQIWEVLLFAYKPCEGS